MNSALLSAFLSKPRTALMDLTGHLPWVHLNSLHWADLPTPEQNDLKGMILFLS